MRSRLVVPSLIALATSSVLAASVNLVAQDPRTVSVTIQAAMAAETIEGDLAKAIALYERAIKEAGTDRALAANPLLLLANAQARAVRAETRNRGQTGVSPWFDPSLTPLRPASGRSSRRTASCRRRASPTTARPPPTAEF